MEKLDNILNKLPIKSYTSCLEKILEKKNFSIDTKNLLLSMLYKIENGYNDYEKVKAEVTSKSDFVENIFNIIENKCENIIVAEFDSKASKILKEKKVKYIIEKEKGKIICYANEFLLLKCILKIGEDNIVLPEEIIVLEKSISNILNTGSRIGKEEVIRDFNGWSWDIALKQIENLDINIIYQTIIYLMGNENVENWIKNDSKLVDYLSLFYEKLRKNYDEEIATKFIILFCRISINITIKKDEQEANFWKERKEKYQKQLNDLENKKEFLKEKTKQKKDYSKKIEKIDKILNDSEKLKEEYKKRNEKLPNKEKIFSISHLTERLEKEREELLENIRKCNMLIDPKGYVERKKIIEEKVDFLKNINLEGKEECNKKELIQFCNLFLDCFKMKIYGEKTKIEILKDIYKLRYYGFLNFNKNGKLLKEIPEISKKIDQTIEILVKKATENYVIGEVTKDIEANNKIISEIFDIKMIDLNHLVIQTKIEDGKLFIEYFDEKILEISKQLESEKTLKLNKKTKIFI